MQLNAPCDKFGHFMSDVLNISSVNNFHVISFLCVSAVSQNVSVKRIIIFAFNESVPSILIFVTFLTARTFGSCLNIYLKIQANTNWWLSDNAFDRQL